MTRLCQRLRAKINLIVEGVDKFFNFDFVLKTLANILSINTQLLLEARCVSPFPYDPFSDNAGSVYSIHFI